MAVDSKREGVLFYDSSIDRMDIRFFDNYDYYGGLHCGTTIDVFINNEWVPTRMEKCNDWYLVGTNISDIAGLKVRM